MGTDASGQDTGAALAALLLMPVGVFVEGYVLSSMWGWFVVPLGVQAISPANAAGLAAIAAVIKGYRDTKRDSIEVLGDLVGTIIGTLFMWGIGAAIHFWWANGL